MIMDRPPPDPAKLLASWREWGGDDVLPGQVMSNLKKGGLRDILEGLNDTALLEPWMAWERARLGPRAALEQLAEADIEARLESLASV
jgi:hypothetical protein